MGLSPENKALVDQLKMGMKAVVLAGELEWLMNAARSEATTAQAEALAKAEGDRDALLQAIGFTPRPLDDDRDADIVIKDARALRPAMVEARRARDAAQDKLATCHAHAGELIREWVKDRFGKWITYKSAWTLANSLFGSERAATRPTKEHP